jgi:2-polyprenyl-6-methoxyphenol hydroxylase-like FAD-dependent oxidoreductase
VNHAILDACQLADTIKAAADGQMPMALVIREYERQMRPRAKEAVETSRQAGHGHCYAKVDKEGSFALLGEKPV